MVISGRASPEPIRGDILLSIDKKAVGAVLLLFAVGCFGGGIAGTVYGHYWTLALIGISPFLAWMAASLMAERLAVTTDGVYHVCGKGAAQRPEVRAAATWEEIGAVELEVKTTRDSKGRASSSYTLVFARSEGKPLRYLVGIPSQAQLVPWCRDSYTISPALDADPARVAPRRSVATAASAPHGLGADCSPILRSHYGTRGLDALRRVCEERGIPASL